MKPKDLAAASEALAKAGLWQMVNDALRDARFDLADLLGHGRDVPRLVVLRFRIWAKARAIKDSVSKAHAYSLPELGRLFNRNHTTIAAGIRSVTPAKPHKRRRATR